jgi:hypothetical protein
MMDDRGIGGMLGKLDCAALEASALIAQEYLIDYRS